MSYEFIDDVAIADIAFKASGTKLEELFQAASDALMNVMVEDLQSIELREQRAVTLENPEPEMLLFDFLQEFIYFKDSEKLLLRAGRTEISQDPAGFSLQSELAGEPIDLTRHRLRVDVKAVTLHRFRLKKTDQGWEAFVILDI